MLHRRAFDLANLLRIHWLGSYWHDSSTYGLKCRFACDFCLQPDQFPDKLLRVCASTTAVLTMLERWFSPTVPPTGKGSHRIAFGSRTRNAHSTGAQTAS